MKISTTLPGILLLALTIALVSGCSVDDYDIFGGSPSENQYSKEHYAMSIANYLVVDNLKALESALTYDKYTGSETTSDSYKTNGVSLRKPGAVWTVNTIDPVKGVTVVKTSSENEWVMTLDTKIAYIGMYYYPTKYTLTATMVKDSLENHYDWNVSLNGSRDERKGYGCTFWSEDSMLYEATSQEGWTSCKGALLVEVKKNDKKVERWRMQLDGGPGEYSFVTGL